LTKGAIGGRIGEIPDVRLGVFPGQSVLGGVRFGHARSTHPLKKQIEDDWDNFF
jgi:hypothetical protein